MFNRWMKMRQPVLIDCPGKPAPIRKTVPPANREIFSVDGQNFHLGTTRTGCDTGATLTGTMVFAPVSVVIIAVPLVTEDVEGTNNVGFVTAAVGTTLAGIVNPGSATVTVAPKNPAVRLTGGTNAPAHPENNKTRISVLILRFSHPVALTRQQRV
jgi:hypothetical protein